MKMRWLVWLVWLGVIAVLLLTALFLEPTRVVWGYLKGESFYRGRPTSYWRSALLDEAPAAHVAARSALKDGRAEAIPVLIQLLASRGDRTYAEVRWTAAALLGALGQIGSGDARVVEALTAALKDSNERVRRDAVRSLGQLGAAAKSAAPTISKLRNDPAERVRTAAAAALRQIDSKTDKPK